MTYEEYEAQCDIQRQKNKEYLEIFRNELQGAGLKPKTIDRHLENVDLYINSYLFQEEPMDMQEGCGDRIDDYLGYYYIYKCMWSTPGNIKTTAASIKKFYKSMCDHEYVDKTAYKELCQTIKENMEMWQEECGEFNGDW